VRDTWDLAIVGAGPAGASAALGALADRPDLRVLLLDRQQFPRDKSCGDGIAPQVLDELSEVGVHGLLDDWTPVRELELHYGEHRVRRGMRRPTWVVPRREFDARLVAAAVRAGASFQRRRVRTVERHDRAVWMDGDMQASVVVGADGAHSVVRQCLSIPPPRRQALAIRGYAPVSDGRHGLQSMVFGHKRQPSYAWSFDRGDGYANVGYGQLLGAADHPTRDQLIEQLETLLPGSTVAAERWRGHHLPLSSWRWRPPDGAVLLAGDAAGLVSPMTGEGIYYAVATGIRAGRAAVRALDEHWPRGAGHHYRRTVGRLLGRHLRHTAAVDLLQRLPGVIPAGVDAAARHQPVFDDLVEIGLARGTLTPRVLAALAASAARQRSF
jgi:menaquinone-9 beta-reductase